MGASAGWGSTPRPSGPGRRKEMKLPLRLGLGTTYIAPFMEGLA